MAAQIELAVAVETAMICGSCKHISHTKGEAAIGRAAAYTCGFCGHQMLIPLHRSSTIAKAREWAGLP